ncbi:MAG: DoxX family protein [Marinilabiliaceae bacterium]|nr:DoxX family protein [Marinilabiliaceae bacterium]
MNKKELMLLKQPVIEILRVLVGILFIFSGFVKCVDPMGGAIKIDDYFIAWGMSEIPMTFSIALSVIQNILEFTVGFALLFRIFIPLASLGALLFMVIFTPLTLYIAIANPVSDCGCFGDAVKLTNWQTFWKNMIFLPMSLIVYFNRHSFKEKLSRWRRASICGCGVMLSLTLCIKGLTDEPIIDFRPYSVGTNIREAMEIPDDAPQPVYKTTFILKKDGIEKEFDEDNYPYNDTTWVYVDTHTEVLDEGFTPAIKDFTLTDKYEEVVTNELLGTEEQIVLVVSPSLENVRGTDLERISHLSDICVENDLRMYILTASTLGGQERFTTESNRRYEYLQGDETMLKTIVRGDAGVIVLQHGTIVAKYHIAHLPMDRDWKNPAASFLRFINADYEQSIIICITLAVALLVIALHHTKHKQHTKFYEKENRSRKLEDE